MDKNISIFNYLGKVINNLYSIVNNKVRVIGIPITLVLTYGSLTALMKFLKIEISSFSVFVVVATIYLTLYLWSQCMTQKYYIIKFERYGVCRTYKKMFFSKKYKSKNGNIVYNFKSTITLSDMIKEKEKIEMVLRTNIINITQSSNKRLFSIITNKNKNKNKEIDYKEMAKDGTTFGMKIYAALKYLGIEIYDIKENENAFKQEITFNSQEAKNKIEKNIQEIEHLTKFKIKLLTDEKQDFKIVINKDIGALDFKPILFNTSMFTDNLIVGVDENLIVKTLDIRKIYHSIVAGTTGYGKSNLSHVLISSLIKSDFDCAMFLLDPKKSELKRYRDIDRVFYSGDNNEILEVLKKITEEMDRRNEIIEKDKFVNSIETWNKKYSNDKISYIVVYIEEIADLMTSSNKEYKEEFQDIVIRLSQLGRSTGIRLFLSTQYPKKEVLSTLIKNNAITRFGFAVSNSVESNVIMDSNVLTELTEKGDLILKNQGLTRLKVPLVTDDYIEPLIDYLEKNHSNNGKYTLGKRYVSDVSNAINTSVEAVSLDKNAVPEKTVQEKTVINNRDDLLNFYLVNCKDKVYSVRQTYDKVNIGKTKIQEYRKQLLERKNIIYNEKTRETYLNKIKITPQ